MTVFESSIKNSKMKAFKFTEEDEIVAQKVWKSNSKTCVDEFYPTAEYLPGNSITSKPLRVLLAEDDSEMRHLLAWFLREEGYEVIEACNGKDPLHFLEACEVHRSMCIAGEELDFNLIVSDIIMPGMSGLEVLSNLRKRDTKIPFILITAFGSEDTKMEAKKLGASAFLEKPFDIDDFQKLVRTFLGTWP